MRTITIDGLFNVRADATHAPWLLRAGAPDALTPEGERSLRELGVATLLDLREPSEATPHTHTIPISRVPLYGAPPPLIGRLEAVYEALLRTRAAAIAEAVGVVADAETGILVHCSAGKDRTGLVVALALRAAGSDVETVVADYHRSGVRVRPRRVAAARLAARGATTERERVETMRLHLDSPREAILHALDVIDELGGPVDYLLANGLSPHQITALRAKAGARA